ncbi:hypothetical protein [uncultured Pontibacter sp.]|uniref:hypothetical protein n=1 Tax=uncultured Pontibacter sp. TaxID=453356 RepID=UPI002629CE47|nr:hypothetical protein [uncultured Pontibacter sp.]
MPFNEFFQRLFGFKKAAHRCISLHRSQKFLAAYQDWLAAQVYLNWTGPFFKAYHYQKCSISATPCRVQLVEEPNLQGAILFYDASIGAQNFAFLFELLKERTQQLGYKLHSSDTRLVQHERYTEQVEHHVLNPPPADVPGTTVCNQLYGSIHLDFVSVNKHPGYIRFVANTYTNAFFSKPLPFMQLLEDVLQPQQEQR